MALTPEATIAMVTFLFNIPPVILICWKLWERWHKLHRTSDFQVQMLLCFALGTSGQFADMRQSQLRLLSSDMGAERAEPRRSNTDTVRAHPSPSVIPCILMLTLIRAHG